MMSAATPTTKEINLERAYLSSITMLGAAGAAFSAYRFHNLKLDEGFFVLAVVTIALGPRVVIKIPGFRSYLSSSDVFVFLAMLLYGGEAAILLAGAEALAASFSFSRRYSTILFNCAVGVLSTMSTVWALRSVFGKITEVPPGPLDGKFVSLLCLMALVQFAVNSILVATGAALKDGRPIFTAWLEHYPWCSVSYFGGAAAAGFISRMVLDTGWWTMILAFPIVATVYLSYRTYGRNLEAKAEVERLLKQSEEANRLKDEFLSTLSHELRTPLTSILLWTEVVLNCDESRAQFRTEGLATIRRNAMAQVQMIEDLLDISRITSGKLLLNIDQISLEEVVADAIKVIRPAANAKRIEILFNADHDKVVVAGDRGRLQQVIWNLFSNAVKFTPDGGEVSIRLSRNGSNATFSVSDTGQGISPEFLPYVFERFRQGDSTLTRKNRGLGLGLAIVRHLIELHGGTVQVESEGEGHGATFSFVIPLAEVGVEKGEAELINDLRKGAAAVGNPGQLAGLRVLVIDDETDARRAISMVLAQSGAEVWDCASARDSLQVVEQWKPDVLLSDIAMPGEDGYALIRAVRERGGRIPAAALTAYAREEDRERAIAAGYQAHVAKPVGPAELVATVARLAGRVA